MTLLHTHTHTHVQVYNSDFILIWYSIKLNTFLIKSNLHDFKLILRMFFNYY